jgi:hypothetical protein
MPLRRLVPLLAVLLAVPVGAQGLPDAARSYLGEWIVTDDDTGRPEALMEVYTEGGAVHARLVRSLEDPSGAVVCDECEGEYAGADLRGLRILRDLEWEGDGFGGGRVLDPRSGKTYKAALSLEGRDHLRVRGYLGVRALGRTQVWQRADRSGAAAGG